MKLKPYEITTQKQIRELFWESHPELPRKAGSHNDQHCDTRSAFCFFLDNLQRDGRISQALSYRATL